MKGYIGHWNILIHYVYNLNFSEEEIQSSRRGHFALPSFLSFCVYNSCQMSQTHGKDTTKNHH